KSIALDWDQQVADSWDTRIDAGSCMKGNLSFWIDVNLVIKCQTRLKVLFSGRVKRSSSRKNDACCRIDRHLSVITFANHSKVIVTNTRCDCELLSRVGTDLKVT